MTVEVEPAAEHDALAVLTVHRSVIAEGRWFVTQPDELDLTVAKMAERIRDHGRSANSVFLVAREGRSVLGFVTVAGGALRITRHAAKLEIMVADAARGRGVGGALLEAALDWARANEMLTKVGLTVFADNARAIALYRAHGFVEEGRRVAEYRMPDGAMRDDVLMARAV